MPLTKFFTFAHFGLPSSGFDATHTFVRSHFLPPFLHSVLRALIALYIFTTIAVGYTYQSKKLVQNHLQDVNIEPYIVYTIGPRAVRLSFSYFTWITWWSLGFYFAVSSFHTFYYARYQRTYLHDTWPKSLQLMHTLFFTTVINFPFLVSIVFWCTMYSGPWPTAKYEQWINISVHGLNSLFAIFEIVFSAAVPQPMMHLSVILAILSVYLGLAYLTKYTEGVYVYEWLNPEHGVASVVGHVIGYAAVVVALFWLVWAACLGKERLVARAEQHNGLVIKMEECNTASRGSEKA